MELYELPSDPDSRLGFVHVKNDLNADCAVDIANRASQLLSSGFNEVLLDLSDVKNVTRFGLILLAFGLSQQKILSKIKVHSSNQWMVGFFTGLQMNNMFHTENHEA